MVLRGNQRTTTHIVFSEVHVEGSSCFSDVSEDGSWAVEFQCKGNKAGCGPRDTGIVGKSMGKMSPMKIPEVVSGDSLIQFWNEC